MADNNEIRDASNFSSSSEPFQPYVNVERTNMFYGALPIHFELAKSLRANQTEAERFLWDHLSYIKISGIRFKCQHPVLYFIADFYSLQAKRHSRAVIRRS